MKTCLIWLTILVAPLAFGEDLILCGPGGTPEYDARFLDWGQRLRQALIDQCGREAGKIKLFTAAEKATELNAEPLTLENLSTYMAQLKQSHNQKEPLFIYLIGHGSHLRQEAKFQIPGKDLSAKTLAEWLKDFPASATVIINGSSASAGFINVLSGPDRVIASATKSVREIQATEYMGFFVQALEEGLADRDGDNRVSVYEACWRAASLTQNYYTTQGLIATEHAIIDDDGDGRGSRLFLKTAEATSARSANGADGLLSKRLFIKDFRYPPGVPKSLVAQYDAAVSKILDLKQKKGKMAAKSYRQQLENLLINAARINRRIHKLMRVPAEGG